MIKKNYRMNEEDLEVIQQVKKQHGFHSDSETLRYIVRSHIVQNQEENSKLLSILRKVEEKIDILFDIENTIIKAGDTILTMTDLKDEWKVRELMESLTTKE